MTFQGDPNRPPLQDDPALRNPLIEDRGFGIMPILAAAALVLVLGYLFLGPSGDSATTPTGTPNTTRIERTTPPPATPGPAQTAPAPSQTTPTTPN